MPRDAGDDAYEELAKEQRAAKTAHAEKLRDGVRARLKAKLDKPKKKTKKQKRVVRRGPGTYDVNLKQYGLRKNPFKSLTGLQVGREFLLHVYWSGLDDGGDDGRGHLMQRGKVTCDMGLENFPDPPPTDDEMQKVTFAAKMAMAKVLRERKRAKR